MAMTTRKPHPGRKGTRFGTGSMARQPKAKGPAGKASQSTANRALVEQATRNTLAVNPLIGIRRKDLLDTASLLVTRLARQPRAMTKQTTKFLGELGRAVAGRSTLAPASGDRRFADPAWSDSTAFRRLLQSYVALARTADQMVDEAKLDPLNTERARFVVSLVVDAVAPTNFMASNPAALKKLVATRGTSAIRGLANLVEDLTSGALLPKQVDARGYAVGKNLATTKGAVVFRNDLLELMQYAPTTAEVHQRPLLIVPPQINKYYVFDLAPGKSLVQWSLASSVQTFAISWRNPTKQNADWGIDDYVAAIDQAVDAMRNITGSPDVNVWGACSGGITLSAFVAWLAAGRTRKVNAATLTVCVLDMASVEQTTVGLFVTPATLAAAKAASRKSGVVKGTDLARMFAWMRPNDLVWNYVVNNYLLGNDPPAHDILAWNNDTTRLPAHLHADFLDLYQANPFSHPGRLRIRGRNCDMGRIAIETYVVGGLSDHITPWQGVYRTAQLYGSHRSTFVLSNSGHIQSMINPPSSSRSWFMTGPPRAATPEAWLERQTKTDGSWWPHWREWIQARSGALRAAPSALGSARHAPLVDAPGTYVLEK